MSSAGRWVAVVYSAERNWPVRAVAESSVWSLILQPKFDAVPSRNACTSEVTFHFNVTLAVVPVAVLAVGDATTAGWFVHVIVPSAQLAVTLWASYVRETEGAVDSKSFSSASVTSAFAGIEQDVRVNWTKVRMFAASDERTFSVVAGPKFEAVLACET